MASEMRRRRALTFLALFLLSASLCFLQLGFLRIDLGEIEFYLFLMQVPVAVTALLLGPRYGLLQGLLTGASMALHARFQPTDGLEYFYMIPLDILLPLTLTGFLYGLAFSRALRPDQHGNEPQGTRRLLRLALACLVGVAGLELLYDMTVALWTSDLSELQLSSLRMYTEVLGPLSLRNTSEFAITFAVVALVDTLRRRVLRLRNDLSIRTFFGARLFALLVLTYTVVAAISFTIITYRSEMMAKESMQAELAFLDDELTAREEQAAQDGTTFDKGAEVTQLLHGLGPLNELYLMLVAPSGEIRASNHRAYRVGLNINDINYEATDLFDELSETRAVVEFFMSPDREESPNETNDNWISYLCASKVGDDYLVCSQLRSSIHERRSLIVLLNTLTAGTLAVAAFFFASRLLGLTVAEPIDSANASLAKITSGDLDEMVHVYTGKEFASLSSGINVTVAALKEYAAEEQRRIQKDLDTAKTIQESALPHTFPSGAHMNVYASMQAAKYVGGDFYDIFMLDEHTLGFLIADVSGKGIPAALFMMEAKAHITMAMRSVADLAQAIQDTNVHLCEGNDTNMFVTLWCAKLDLTTGELTYVNAGHNPPLLRHQGVWTWLNEKASPLLGVMDFLTFKSMTITLAPHDEILLYTDGVNEAMNPREEQYGNDRLMAFVEAHGDLHPHELDDALRADVALWADGAEQSDDITLLTLEFL